MGAARQRQENADVAALSAGIVAAVLTIYIDPGEYGVMSLVVSFALAIVMFAFTWRQGRRWDGSLAVGAILALALLPALGFFHEAALREGIVRQLFKLDYDNTQSAVADWMIARDWLILFPLFSAIDIAAQRMGRGSPPENAA
jgi:hypothetical protein